VLILIGGLAITSASSFCYVSAMSKELKEAGKYYKEHSNSLEGDQPKEPEKK
jgi:hypothetical protein